MSTQPCQKPYKRHSYQGEMCCHRCGCPSPKWRPNGKRYKPVLLRMRPARRPRWWPKGDDGRAAWATLNVTSQGVWGYTIGRQPNYAVSPRWLWAAVDSWEEDNDNRLWDFRVETIPRTARQSVA